MSILEQLMTEIEAVQGRKHTSPAGAHSSPTIHGPGSLFGQGGLRRDVITSRMQPDGLASLLPVRGVTDTNPLFPYITGFQAPEGEQPTGDCDDGPTAGAVKTCLQTAQFGRYVFQTRELDISKVGQQVDRGEFFDHTILNDPLVNELAGLFPNLADTEAIGRAQEVMFRLLELGVAFQGSLSTQTYTGTGLTNEFMGLDLLISTTKYDAKTGTDCPSLASDVRNFSFGNIATVTGAEQIVTVLTSMWRNLNNNASGMNFGRTSWALVMRTQLFHELTDVWPSMYVTNRALPAHSNVSINVSGTEQSNMRDAMRNGNYLVIDGIKVPVITDNAIAQVDRTGGDYASDIYIVPLSVRGGRVVTFWETFDYAAGTVSAIRDGRLGTDFWTDGGRYLWHKKPPKNWCAQWTSKIEPRLIVLTPHLAGRLMNIEYTPERLYRGWLQDDLGYVNGGVTGGYDAPNYYSEANPPA